MAGFVPRHVFPTPSNLPKSYFLGHHRAGLTKMTSLLSTIDLIIECRDARVPLTSTNPLFETLLSGRPRLIVFTKTDLASPPPRLRSLLSRHLAPSSTLFTSPSTPTTLSPLLSAIRAHAASRPALTPSRLLVLGMPNVGKSTLLNALRSHGVGPRPKAARTGAQPGITRAVGTNVKIMPSATEDPQRGVGAGVYLLDTPGVFVPYLPDAEAMLKLSLVGCVKDGIVPLETLADYLLYQVNKVDPGVYGQWCGATNDVMELLEGVARGTGRLGKGGVPDLEGAALWWVQRWRTGQMGKFGLDEVDEEALTRVRENVGEGEMSWNQARKRGREARKKKAVEI